MWGQYIFIEGYKDVSANNLCLRGGNISEIKDMLSRV